MVAYCLCKFPNQKLVRITKLTIRPSPLPISTRDPDLFFKTFITFSICVLVAGTNGRQTFLNAGTINGPVTAYRATNDPPTTQVAITPSRFLKVPSPDDPCL